MRPILMKGHERPLTFLRYNCDGDLLFSCAKDHRPHPHGPTVWLADNGEHLGTYRGHNGAIWSCDVSSDSARLITGSTDQTGRLWDVQMGQELFTFAFSSPARAVEFAVGDRLAVATAVEGEFWKWKGHRAAAAQAERSKKGEAPKEEEPYW